jgi:hypothetical protein
VSLLEILSLMAKDEAKEEEEISVRKSVYGRVFGWVRMIAAEHR